MITQLQLKTSIPLINDIVAHTWFTPLTDILTKYSITSNARIAAFLAQTSHESTAYTAFVENLNYSADALVKIFPSHFHGDAANYHRKPEMIANRIYASRMGNGDEASGDGWRFKGRGLIQLTGRENYTLFAASLGKTIEDTIAYLETQAGALESAAWYWSKHNLNALADRGDNLGITKAINGGTIGFAERVALTTKILKIIS